MATPEAMAEGFDLRTLPPAFYEDPYPVYRLLRERWPVRRLPDGALFLTRWADLDQVYRDSRTFTSDKHAEFAPKFGATPLYEHHTTSLVFNDAPLHGRVRRLITGALTPRAIAGMEPALTALVDRLLDAMAARGEADLIEDFAAAIPVEVIGTLLGVPPEERGPLRGWSLAILGALEPALTPEAAARGNAAVSEFLAYLRGLVARRRAAPGDPATDVLTRLIAGEADGTRLSEAELLHNCIFLLNAGHETTTNLIGNGLEALLRFPAERARLLAEPGLIGSAVEEVLRFESSNQLGNRGVAADCEIGGVAVPAGTRLTLCIGAANRDPAHVADPERFDIARHPNRHLAFAAGPHQCAGLALARLEGRVAIGRFLARFPGYALAGPPVRGGRARFRGFLHLPARLG
ncbi:cytochrome P450 [Roseicella frigidaeris]|uniref:Cytochrome P450 n=1 Tax=Roseicella frigidaeris TaxID=2230885 RepID=A0A327MBS1_9PROT|nr:cytochrome P450 [Roseicella frigidaeris]RAI59614.1 cytochrome P450 [Roseicella frigidaeris]